MSERMLISPFAIAAQVEDVNMENMRAEIKIDHSGKEFCISVPLHDLGFEIRPGSRLVVEGIDYGPGLDLRIFRIGSVL